MSSEFTAFTRAESEFYISLTLLNLNVTTICELGAPSAHSAIAWLESVPWVSVYSFARPLHVSAEGEGSSGDVNDNYMRTRPPREGIPTDEREFVDRQYPRRFIPLQPKSADDFQDLARDLSIPTCGHSPLLLVLFIPCPHMQSWCETPPGFRWAVWLLLLL